MTLHPGLVLEHWLGGVHVVSGWDAPALRRYGGRRVMPALSGGGVIENRHSTEVESPPPPPLYTPRVCMSGSLRTGTRPTVNLLLLPTCLYEHSI